MKSTRCQNPHLKPVKPNSPIPPLSREQHQRLQADMASASPLTPSAREFVEPSTAWMLGWLDPLQKSCLEHTLQIQGAINPSNLHLVVNLIKIAFQIKLNAMSTYINLHHGPRLYQMAQKCRGKTWIVCTIAEEEFLQAPPAPIHIRVAVSDAVYAEERSPELLQMLIDMPTSNYMLAFEVLSESRGSIMSNYVLDPLDTRVTAMQCPWQFVLNIIELPPIPSLPKVICRICNNVAPPGFTFGHCGKCLEQRYCSQHCQRVDWVNHRRRCALLRQLHDARELAAPPVK